jgi:hypothetical protein
MRRVDSLEEYINTIKGFWNDLFILSLVPFNLSKTDKLVCVKKLIIFSVDKNIRYTEMFPGLQNTLIKVFEKYKEDLPINYLDYWNDLIELYKKAKKENIDGKLYGSIMFKGICEDKLDQKIEDEIFKNAGKIFTYNFEHPPFHLF